MIVGLKMICISSEHYTIQIFSNIFSSFCNISHSRRTSILKLCAAQTRKVAEYTARWILATGCGIHKISFLQERQLCKSFVHPTRLAWPIFHVISMPGRCIWRLVIFGMIYGGHINSARGFSLGCFHVPGKVPKIPTRHGIQQLEQCYHHSRILTLLVLAWNGIVQMDSRDNVILIWWPGSGITQNMSWLLWSHMAHAQCL